jgi:serine protease Do
VSRARVCGGLAGSFVLAGTVGLACALGAPPAVAQRGGPSDHVDPSSLSHSRRTAIVTAAQRVSPAVVSVSVVTTRIVRADPYGLPFHDEFFDRFFPPSLYRERVPGLGSGVIVDPDGIVLTNSHVIRDAEEVKVNLPDGRHYDAKLLGDSPVYDLAVLKIPGDHLPVALLGDSDSLVVGEWAIAIGNPFGFLLDDPQPTVTAGVVSATRRDIKAEATSSGMYKNMIQTDAAINPGNSGGALVNADGEVIGINTFIFTNSGGSIGLGFAIPINLAKKVLNEVRHYGRVRVAWPGMTVQPVSELLARRLGWDGTGGLVVSAVDRGGPADHAGLRPLDRIRRVNGRVTNDVEDAQASIYGAQVGDRLTLDVERDGKKQTLVLTLEEAPGR